MIPPRSQTERFGQIERVSFGLDNRLLAGCRECLVAILPRDAKTDPTAFRASDHILHGIEDVVTDLRQVFDLYFHRNSFRVILLPGRELDIILADADGHQILYNIFTVRAG